MPKTKHFVINVEALSTDSSLFFGKIVKSCFYSRLKINEQQFFLTFDSPKWSIVTIWHWSNVISCRLLFRGWKITRLHFTAALIWELIDKLKAHGDIRSPSAQNIDEFNGSFPFCWLNGMLNLCGWDGEIFISLLCRRWTSCFRSGCFTPDNFAQEGNFLLGLLVAKFFFSALKLQSNNY